MKTVREILEPGLALEAVDEELSLQRAIVYAGPGWYSLVDNVYKKGTDPTYSRIRIVEQPAPTWEDMQGPPMDCEYGNLLAESRAATRRLKREE